MRVNLVLIFVFSTGMSSALKSRDVYIYLWEAGESDPVCEIKCNNKEIQRELTLTTESNVPGRKH